MLDYRLDDETETLRKTVREFAQEVIAPQIGAFYERDEFPTAIVRQMGELGLFGLPFPEEYGGAGGTYFDLCVVLEELARVDSSMAITVEAGPEFRNVNIMAVAHGTDKRLLLDHKSAIDQHLRSRDIPVSYTNVFWGGRSEIKPSEISPRVYHEWLLEQGKN